MNGFTPSHVNTPIENAEITMLTRNVKVSKTLIPLLPTKNLINKTNAKSVKTLPRIQKVTISIHR